MLEVNFIFDYIGYVQNQGFTVTYGLKNGTNFVALFIDYEEADNRLRQVQALLEKKEKVFINPIYQ